MKHGDNKETEIQGGVLFEVGSVFEVVGVSYNGFILKCKGEPLSVDSQTFSAAFNDSNINI